VIEKTILSNLLYNEEYARNVFPYIKEEYFESQSQKKLFQAYSEYMDNFKEPPSMEALQITIENLKGVNEETFKEINKLCDSLEVDEKTNQQWLVGETEKFCQERDLYNSIHRAILIIQGEDKVNDKGNIPKMLSDSLGISFDSNLGHDYAEDLDERYEFYHRREERIEFDIDLLNTITKGGLPRKSLTVFMAETGGGKTIVKCHAAAAAYALGKNVLYITAEMAEERIAERIDANLLGVTMDEVKEIPRDVFAKKVNRVKSKTPGRLKIKEYPTGAAHAGHFRHFINELQMKENFVPDIIFIDYLNICGSSRIKGAAAANSYTLVKSIAEELRGLAMEFNLPIVTSTQLNRGGYGNSEVDLTNISESMGLGHTADAIFAIINSEDLSDRGQIMFKQLKNRWGDLNYYRKFVVGIDRSRMKLYNVDLSAQSEIEGNNSQKSNNSSGPSSKLDFDTPTFDKTRFGKKRNFSTGGIK